MATDDYSARVLEEDPLTVMDSDTSKWTAIHHALDPSVGDQAVSSSGPGSIFTVAWILGVALGLLWVLRNGRAVVEQWQENVHRRANRRRHGIPDDDDRPFNVAYAAAALARRQREEQGKKRLETARRELSQPKHDDSDRINYRESMELRQRSLQPARARPFEDENSVPFRGSLSTASENNRAHVPSKTSTPRVAQFRPQKSTDSSHLYDSRDRNRTNHSQLPGSSSGVDGPIRGRFDVNGVEMVPTERRKHHEVDETDDEDRSPKKSRVTINDDVDGDSDVVLDDAAEDPLHGPSQVPKRGSKRHANEGADEQWEMSKDKRARKASSTLPPGADDVDVDMDHDDSDAEPEAARGTKRDRGDAEFIADTTPYDTDESSMPRRAHKRRASTKEQVAPRGLPPRGRKRDRPQGFPSSGDEAESEEMSTTRRKRGRPSPNRQAEDTDVVSDGESELEPEVSSDPACGGRRIGETWEVNGRSYKVGLDGRRLRHTLVKQSRTKFPMPKDSIHHDAHKRMDIIVEKWLNDEEYNAAKGKYQLAWQDDSPSATPEKPPLTSMKDEQPSPAGKRLLWGGPPPSPMKGRLSLHSPSIQNPFDLAPNNSGRRVASAQVSINNHVESPKLRNSKSFSKWEKQDLEASSLKKMRARMEKQKADAAAAKPATASTPTPLAPTTNTQAQPPPVLPNIEAAKPLFPPPVAQPSAPSVNIFAKPAISIPSSSGPNISIEKTLSVPSGGDVRPSGGAASMPAPQTSSVAAEFTSKPVFSFNVTPASASTSSAPDQQSGQKPSFTFNVPQAPQATALFPSVQSAVTPTAPKSAPPSEPAKSDTPKVAFNFSVGSGPTPSFEPNKGGIPNIFAKPTPDATPAAAAMSASASTPPGSSPFSWSQPPPSTQGSSSAKPAFQFGVPGGQSNLPSSSGGAGSLLKRLAPAPDSSTLSQPKQAQSGWSSQPKQAQSGWSSQPKQAQSGWSSPPKQAQSGWSSQPKQAQSGWSSQPKQAQSGWSSQPKQAQSGWSSQPNQAQSGWSSTPEGGQTTSSPSPFGKPVTSTQPPSSNIFGQQSAQAPQPVSNLFGPTPEQTANKPLSGQQDAQSQAQPGSSLFGPKPEQKQGDAMKSLFGQQDNQSLPSNLFGQKPDQVQESVTKSLFGQPGAQSQAQPAGNLFGPKPEQGQAKASFGQQAVQPQNQLSSNIFGPKPEQGQENASKSLFGQQGSQSQASPSSDLFGPKPGQGQQNDAGKSAFGFSTSDPAKSGPFGAPTGGTSSAFSTPPAQTSGSAAPSFSFSTAQPSQQATPFSFGFGGQTPTGSTSQAFADKPSTPTTNPSNAPAPSSGFSFNFGQTSATSSQTPFSAFGSKGPDAEKK